MTHKLISIEKAAEWLGVPLESVLEFVRKGWLTPDVPGEVSYFDASKVQRLKQRLSRLRRKKLLSWSIFGAIAGAALVALFVQTRSADSK
ncbi:MAG TPA: hypothetical protein VIG62_11225 [Blastocatellia bacterium]|jgi:hypothetical protein